MDNNLIERIKADREAGTPGPWCYHRDELLGENNRFIADIDQEYAMDNGLWEEDEANARRIARVPGMEARILADADRIEALDAEVARLRDALSNIAVVGFSEDSDVARAIARQTVEQALAALKEQEKDDE